MNERLRIPIALREAHELRLGPGLLTRLGAELHELGLHGRVAVIADATVARLYGEGALRSCTEQGLDATLLTFEPGERSKSLATAERLWDALAEARLDRGDAVLALGGGVTGDLAGFVAATFHRGLPLVQLPTTLLAQVDASIGGKVAIDLPRGKNLVGGFYPPRAILADTATLATLPPRERWNGLAELVKTALAGAPELWPLLERDLERLADGSAGEPALRNAIALAAGCKARLVAADERDHGVRRHLNLGHTFGHALEAALGFGPLLHGEAVLLGLRAATALSSALGRLSTSERERIDALLVRFPPPPAGLRPDRAAVLEALARDKKSRAGVLRFVVLERLGAAAIVELPESAWLPHLDRLLESLP